MGEPFTRSRQHGRSIHVVPGPRGGSPRPSDGRVWVVDRVLGALAAQRLLDLAGRGQRHVPPDAVHGRAQMRGEQGARVAEQAGRDLRRVPGQRPVLHREHVGGVPAQPPGLQRGQHGLLVHHRAAAHVDQERPGPHPGQRGRVNQPHGVQRTGVQRTGVQRTGVQRTGVQRTGVQRASVADQRQQHQHHVAGREQPGQVQPGRRQLASQCRIQRLLVVVHDPGAEPAQPGRGRLPDLARARDADGGARQPGAVELRPPAGELAAAHVPVGRAELPGEAEDQRDGELRGGHGEQVRQDGQPHAPPGARSGVEVVVTLQRRADHPQPGAAGQEAVVHRVGHAGDQPVRGGGQFGHPRAGPDSLGGRRHPRLAESGQVADHLGMHPVGHHDLRHAS